MELLKVKGLTKYFGGLIALKDVTLSLSSGRIKSIIGPNGAGKTTLFNVISGTYAPDGGDVFLGDHNISGESPERVAFLGVARTFQVVKPFRNLTVLENVLIGTLNRAAKMKLAREKAEEILEYIGMVEKAEWPAKRLTLEDLKRLELGRALAIRPRLLLLDEVMAGLNPTETEEFIGLIRRIRNDGVTILLIEHVMQAVLSLSDEVFVLNYGEKIYEGDTEGVMKDPKVIEAYLGEESFLA
jgi:branched-chain amino acid transport system ATP-binding protein